MRYMFAALGEGGQLIADEGSIGVYDKRWAWIVYATSLHAAGRHERAQSDRLPTHLISSGLNYDGPTRGSGLHAVTPL